MSVLSIVVDWCVIIYSTMMYVLSSFCVYEYRLWLFNNKDLEGSFPDVSNCVDMSKCIFICNVS